MRKSINGNLKIGNTDMDYISFGKGDKVLVIIPGLADGIITVKGTAKVFAFMYRKYAKKFKIYVFSRKNNIKEGYAIKDMAADQVEALKILGIDKPYIIGVSQGGMIAQEIAISYPEAVDKLVLAVTLSKQNDTIQKVVRNWIEMAEQNKLKKILIDTLDKSSDKTKLKKFGLLLAYPLLYIMLRQKKPDRFIIQANACLNHSTYERLHNIKSPTLVIGGDRDRVVGKNTSEEIAEKIRGSRLVILKGFGHSAFEESKDFYIEVFNFLTSEHPEQS